MSDRAELARTMARDVIAGAMVGEASLPIDKALAVADVVLLRLRRLGFEIVSTVD